MIKIQIDNLQHKTKEYADKITSLVAFRVSVLCQSLLHLNGGDVDFSTKNFRSFKSVTKKIIQIVGDDIRFPNGRISYQKSMNNYRENNNKLSEINIVGLIEFCNNLLADNNQQLSELLVCNASDLMTHNEAILNKIGNTDKNIAIIKLAFDYENFDKDISTKIREYFKENKFVAFCPYCNIRPANHYRNSSGEIVDSFELDHFYDKASYPLLSYCLFNLVPSDHTCNSINKKSIQFTDEYHINPHLSGYVNSINFIPFGLNPSYEIEKIQLIISETQGSVLYKKINGDNLPFNESGDLGNINVFKIRSKYSNEKHYVTTILKRINANNSYRIHLKRYLKKLEGLDIKESYKKWYEAELDASFDPNNFNDKAFSKLCRDIHDYYYSKNSTSMNRYIIELINA